MSLIDERTFVQTLQTYAAMQRKESKVEIELRFSSKLHNFPPRVPVGTDRPRDFRFSPTVFHHNYMAVFQYMSERYPGTVCSTIERTFPQGVRQVTDMSSGTSTYMVKTRNKFHDFYPWNVRLSAATEAPYTGSVPAPDTCTYVREKYRTRFQVDPCVSVDLTRVKAGTSAEHFEVELEYTGKTYSAAELDQIRETCRAVLMCLQGTAHVVSYGELFNIALEYETLTKSTSFIGALPDALHAKNASLVRAQPYMITPKYDGQRYLLFASDNGSLYRLGRNHQWAFTGIKCTQFLGTILDAEYVDSTYHVFDILFHCGQDLRGKTLFADRLELVKQVCAGIPGTCAKPYSTSYPMPSVIPCDGVILVPVNEPYPTRKRWPTLLKYKDVHTLDLLVQIHGDDALVYGSKDSGLFLAGTLNTFGQHVVPNTIVECSFNGKTFDYIKTRFDKTHANTKPVIDDALSATACPVDLASLLGPSQSNLKRVHNVVKRDLIARAGLGKSKLRVLELGCGRGGDLYKWDKLGIPVDLVGIDVHARFIDEAKSRIAATPLKYVKAHFVQCDLTQDVPKVSGKFDVVSCQFAIHHFFDSKVTVARLVEFVSSVLKVGGRFIVTTLDASRVLQALCDKTAKGISSTFPPDVLVHHPEMRSYGARVHVDFSDPSFITHQYTNAEYLVFPDTFTTVTQEYHLKLTDTDLFRNSTDLRLAPDEAAYSAMNRWYMFQKAAKKASRIPSVAIPGCSTGLDCTWTTLPQTLALFLGPGRLPSLANVSMAERVSALHAAYPTIAVSVLDGATQTFYFPSNDHPGRAVPEYSHIVLTKHGDLVLDANKSVTHTPWDWLVERVSDLVPDPAALVTFNGKPLTDLDASDMAMLQSSESPLAKAIIASSSKSQRTLVHTWA
ncbi:mRNA cap guanine-N7 methyltransferase [Allomyces javanicus]|nr:mRNA cap guanine-N7 methyltransferase [Allomyces javanicus]